MNALATCKEHNVQTIICGDVLPLLLVNMTSTQVRMISMCHDPMIV